MRVKTVLLLLFAIYTISAQNTIVPLPEKTVSGDGFFVLNSSLPVVLNGQVNDQALRAVERLKTGLTYRTRITFDNQPFIKQQVKSGIILEAKASTRLMPGMDESYTINVDTSAVRITAATTVGVLHGVETLLQLVQKRDSVWIIPALTITDKPMLAYRGLLLDPARRFLSVDAIKKTLDAMAAVKLNVLHLHLSDDQGWRIESKRYPSLQIMASDGKFYTQTQIRDLVKYASDRGIIIIPEVDIPGHATAILTAKPNLASADTTYVPDRSFGIHTPVLNPAKDETYAFLTNLFREIDSLFPGPYIHIGGDEVVYDNWKDNPEIDAFRENKGLKDFKALQGYFVKRMTDSIKPMGKTVIGWEEVARDGLDKEVVLQCWKSKGLAYTYAKQGLKTILSNGYYLDTFYSLKDYYNNDPLPADVNFKPEHRNNYLGAEACLWGELVDERILGFRLWPRMAMLADRFWSTEKRDRRSLAAATEAINLQLLEHNLNQIGAPFSILYEIAGSKDIAPLIELRGLVTPVKGYYRHGSGYNNTLTPLNTFADAADTDPANLDLFYNALREFIIAGSSDANFDLVAGKLFAWEEYYERNKEYYQGNSRLKELEPLAKNLSETARIANEAMEYIVKGKVPKDVWLNNAKKVMEEAKKPVAGVQLTVVDQLEKILVFSKEHDVIVF
ncbi:beta-N-acetylhexosaminidase [Saccharicrinis sp. FJH54]|uniref:beta-N-acetylhexosaminidase n=1 Tax=Saccharicrinis sp. FJH54 TaxID=3344665 RepID=UPI0035D3D935